MTEKTMPDWVRNELAHAGQARSRGELEMASTLRAIAARYDARKKLIHVELINGASFSFPPSMAQGLEHGSAAQLSQIDVTPYGTGLSWPLLNADLTVEGLLTGAFGSRSWMRAHAARAGSVRSAPKAAAARANGLLGGRPRKKSQTV